MSVKKITLFLLLMSLPTLLLAARPSLLSLQLQQAAINEKIAQLEMEDDAMTTQLVVEKAVASTTATSTELSIDGVGINDIPTVTVGGMIATVNAATQTSTHIDASIPAVLQPGTYLVTVATGAQRGEFDAVDINISKTLSQSADFVAGTIPDGKDVGYVDGRSLTINKIRNSSNLRISYTDNFRVIGSGAGACTWEVQVDGMSCPAQALRYSSYATSNINNHYSSTVVGYCQGILAGTHTVSVYVSPAPGYGVSDCYTGWQTTFLLESEEVN